MRILPTIFLLILTLTVKAQLADCDLFCVTEIKLDTSNSKKTLQVTIQNMNTDGHLNYPYIKFIVDDNGDSIVKKKNDFLGFFAHTANSTLTYKTSTVLDSIPANLRCSIHLAYSDLTNTRKDTFCTLTYPCATTGIAKIANDPNQITLYPNPASTYIRLKFNLPGLQSVEVNIYEQNGNLVESVSNVRSEFEIVRKNLPSGLYFVRISGKTGMVVYKQLVLE